ncbi:hypothetical protein C3B64_10395 [Clostridium botulinum]|uniref:Spore coat protein n=1 Tax=Clostridium botulinum TaxID=1491 RepID=A0AAU8YX13_CLOBO|nr:hypothetical protein [Clostridium sporogenes]AVP64652.1 hypothetical protein C3B64_10395 [Clostridium botulinum]MCF4016176.1 hypothetical protein [Clostridium sporogenes]NFG03276.1 hypothetical protein [Clostridium sporogenes]
MLTEQEIMNNAFKEMQFHEEDMAKKYANISEQINDPKLKQMLKGMEQGSRNNYNTLSQTMSKFSII